MLENSTINVILYGMTNSKTPYVTFFSEKNQNLEKMTKKSFFKKMWFFNEKSNWTPQFGAGLVGLTTGNTKK